MVESHKKRLFSKYKFGKYEYASVNKQWNCFNRKTNSMTYLMCQLKKPLRNVSVKTIQTSLKWGTYTEKNNKEPKILKT